MRAALLAGVFVLAAAAAARAQISPGPLSRFHEPLEGARNCRACHATEGVTRDLCLTCHGALGQRIAAGRGLHATSEYRVGCERCHVEHQGRDFDLVFWGEEGRASFDHAQTGFPLQGRHAALTCEACHQANHIRDRAGLAKGGANLKRTFLGLEPGCASCHADPHRGQFAPRACGECHDARQWKPASFDHDRSGFPLTGAHGTVACASCHKAGADGALRFKGTPHQTCASCHQDPHAGRMGARCDSCHDTTGWTRIEPGRFDHSRTRFPLTGRHEVVACDSCHRRDGRTRFAGTPFQTCASCHQDPHAGRLGAACASCHSTAGWQRVAAGAFDHERTRFPLRGRHASVACDSCHRPGRPRTMAHAACTDCHADRHAGQLVSRADGGRCESCHDVAGWKPARFRVADHAKTRMPLTGAHLAVPCDACHREVATDTIAGGRRAGAPAKTERFRFASSACTECHADPHRGRTAKLGTCESCHATTAWSAVRFDHSRTGFALAGAHATVACRACHPESDAFAGRPRECDACHKDPHQGHFARGGRTECARCHEPTAWKQARFDHDRETSFPLVGAHRRVPCAACHLKMTDGRASMRYSGIGKACSDCHGADR